MKHIDPSAKIGKTSVHSLCVWGSSVRVVTSRGIVMVIVSSSDVITASSPSESNAEYKTSLAIAHYNYAANLGKWGETKS